MCSSGLQPPLLACPMTHPAPLSLAWHPFSPQTPQLTCLALSPPSHMLLQGQSLCSGPLESTSPQDNLPYCCLLPERVSVRQTSLLSSQRQRSTLSSQPCTTSDNSLVTQAHTLACQFSCLTVTRQSCGCSFNSHACSSFLPCLC